MLLLEQILSFKSKSNFRRAMSAMKATRKSRKLFLLVKMGANYGSAHVPIQLNDIDLCIPEADFL